MLYGIVLNIHPSTNLSSSRQIYRRGWIDIRNKMGRPMARTEVERRDLNLVSAFNLFCVVNGSS